MPDLPLAEGGRSESGGPNWLLYGGLGLGAVVLLILMNKGSGGTTGTTTAQTSINAALGSVQEENLNIMGQMGQFEQRLNGQLGNLNDNVVAGQDLTVKQSQAATELGNALAGRVMQQDAAAMGNAAASNAWTDYLNELLPGVDKSLADAWKLPVQQPVGNPANVAGVSQNQFSAFV